MYRFTTAHLPFSKRLWPTTGRYRWRRTACPRYARRWSQGNSCKPNCLSSSRVASKFSPSWALSREIAGAAASRSNWHLWEIALFWRGKCKSSRVLHWWSTLLRRWTTGTEVGRPAVVTRRIAWLIGRSTLAASPTTTSKSGTSKIR